MQAASTACGFTARVGPLIRRRTLEVAPGYRPGGGGRRMRIVNSAWGTSAPRSPDHHFLAVNEIRTSEMTLRETHLFSGKN